MIEILSREHSNTLKIFTSVKSTGLLFQSEYTFMVSSSYTVGVFIGKKVSIGYIFGEQVQVNKISL